MKQALAVRGFKGGTRENIEWSQWVRSEKERLSVVMECHGIEWGTKAPTTSTCLCWTKKGAKGERGWRSGNGQGEEREPDGGIGVAAERIGPGGKEHGMSGGGLFCRPGGNFTRGRDIGKCQVLPGEKGKVPAGKNRPRVALSVPQVHRTERKV